MELPGRAVLVPALIAGMLAGAVQAGGLDEVAGEVDPCPPGLTLNDPSMTAEMIRGFWAVRAMSGCARVFLDRATGLPLAPEEVLARVFNGSRIPAPVVARGEEVEVVPLPASALALIAGLAGFAAVRRGRG